MDGDSISANNNYLQYMTIPGGYRTYDSAVPGSTTAVMYAAGPVRDDPKIGFPSTHKIIAIMGGTNDCYLQGHFESAEQAWDDLANWASARHSLGWKVNILTLPSLNANNPQYGTGDACRDAINTIIYAKWAGTFDGMADLAADPHIGPDGSWNTGYFVDGVHPALSTHQNIIAPLVQAQFNLLQ